MKLALFGALFGSLFNATAQEVWTHRYTPPEPFSPICVAGFPGLYLVGPVLKEDGAWDFVRSTDGVAWATVSTLPPDTYGLYSVGREILGIGKLGIWKTSDGISSQWVYQSGDHKYDGPRLAIGNDCLVITLREGIILRATSISGPWVRQIAPPDDILGLAYGNGFFLASNFQHHYLKSLDGKFWQPQPQPVNTRGHVKGFASGIFYSDFGETSSDGVVWNFNHPGTVNDTNFAEAGIGGFVNSGDSSSVYLSQDFVNWREIPSGLSGSVRSLGFCGDLWIATSLAGRIATSPIVGAPPLAAPELSIAPAVEMTWPSIIGRQYQVKGSNDNVTWSNVGLPFLGNGSSLRYTAPANEIRKFFKVEVQ